MLNCEGQASSSQLCIKTQNYSRFFLRMIVFLRIGVKLELSEDV